jgi:hypothetical protein
VPDALVVVVLEALVVVVPGALVVVVVACEGGRPRCAVVVTGAGGWA